MPQKRKKWTNWEVGRLKKVFPGSDDDDLSSSFPNRSVSSVRAKASSLGLKRKDVEDKPKGEPRPVPQLTVPTTVSQKPKEETGVPKITVDTVIANLSLLSQLSMLPTAEDETQNELLKFFKIFEEPLKRKYGINIGNIGKKVGKGTMGAAYEYKDGILKATKDMTEAFSAAAIIGKNLPGVVNVYRVVLFSKREGDKYHLVSDNTFSDKPMANFIMAWIIQEKLRPLDPKLKRAIKKRLRKFKKYMGDGLPFFLRDYFRKRVSRKVIEGTFEKLWRKNDLYSGFWRSLDELSRNGVKFFDIHPDNLMQDSSGKIKIIDLGYSASENRKGVEVVSLEYLMQRIKRGV